MAYALDHTSTRWLADCGAQLRAAIPGARSCLAFNIHREHGRYQLGEYWTEESAVGSSLVQTFREAPPDFLDAFFSVPLRAQTASSVLDQAGTSIEQTLLGPLLGELGAADIFSVAAFGPDGRGAALGVLVDDPSFEIGDPTDWMHVAVHIAAGARLRQRLGQRPSFDEAEAILRPDGEAEQLEYPDAREFLRTAVTHIEQARSGRYSTSQSLELWQSLVEGRWSLVERFDSDRRRFYVALRNPAAKVEAKALTTRQAEVVAYVGSGAGTKAAAYSLGISVSAVRAHLSQAMAKLGVSSRVELIDLWATLQG